MTPAGTILIVDDTAANLQLLSEILTAEGYRTRPADSGALALVSAKASRPDLILLDIEMPHMDGLEVYRRLKADPLCADVPVMFISVSTNLTKRLEGLSLGAVDFLSKPIRREEIVARIATQIELGHLRGELRAQAAALQDANAQLRAELREREAVDAELRASEERFRTVIEQASDAVFILAADGRISEMNSAGCAMLGYARDEVLALSVRDLIPVDPSRPSQMAELAPGQAHLLERSVRRKDGALLTLEVSARRLDDRRIIGIARDVAQRNLLQAQLLQAQKMESVGRLAGGVAHDFNNLLAVILGNVSLASADLDQDDPRLGLLGEIEDAARRGAGLTSQLLAFGRRQVFSPVVLDPGRVIAELEPMIRRLIGETVLVRVTPSERTGSILADRSQVGQVILNFAVNARDAMPGGGTMEIRTGMVHFSASDPVRPAVLTPGNYATIAVSDTGHGMDSATLSRLFEPFFTTKGVGEGTGLGLATALGIARQSGGDIGVQSAVGQGSTFTIYLPIIDDCEDDAPAAPGPSAVRGNETILVVEDNDAFRLVATRILAAAGYTVIAATDGEDALEKLASDPGTVDLVLTDLVMPRLGGRGLRERLAELRPDLKMLFMSGYPGGQGSQGDVGTPPELVIAKPFTPADLAGRVRSELDKPG